MALFGRNKNEEEYIEDEFDNEKSSKANKKFASGLQDLKSENKKKRKEPPKPWTKKERLIVLTILLISIITSTLLAYGSTIKWSLGQLRMPGFNSNFLNIFQERECHIFGKNLSSGCYFKFCIGTGSLCAGIFCFR